MTIGPASFLFLTLAAVLIYMAYEHKRLNTPANMVRTPPDVLNDLVSASAVPGEDDRTVLLRQGKKRRFAIFALRRMRILGRQAVFDGDNLGARLVAETETNIMVALEAAERESAAVQIKYDCAVAGAVAPIAARRNCAQRVFRHNGEIRPGDVSRGLTAHRDR